MTVGVRATRGRLWAPWGIVPRCWGVATTVDESGGLPADTKGDLMRPDPATGVDELELVAGGDEAPPHANPATTYRSRMDQGGGGGGGRISSLRGAKDLALRPEYIIALGNEARGQS